MLAIASRQLYDRAAGDGLVLPLEARVKPATAQADAAEASTGTTAPTTADAAAESSSTTGAAQALAPSGRGAESQPFDITVRDFRGRCHSVRVCGGTSVSRLKTGIAAALGCSVVSHWRLIHDGRPLDDDLDLADYSLAAGALIEVQMTSQQSRLRTAPTANSSAAVAPAGDGRDAASGAGGVGGGSGGGAGTRAGGPVPNCSAPWANPTAKGAAAPIPVQVLLPCGRVVQVNRLPSEDVPQFVCRVLEAEKALLLSTAATPAPAAAAADGAAVSTTAAAAVVKVASPRDLLPGLGPQPAAVARDCGQKPLLWPIGRHQHHGPSGLHTRQTTTGQLKGVVAQKLLAVLLAAAAVVMAMAVL